MLDNNFYSLVESLKERYNKVFSHKDNMCDPEWDETVVKLGVLDQLIKDLEEEDREHRLRLEQYVNCDDREFNNY